jgi:hypothetical protein
MLLHKFEELYQQIRENALNGYVVCVFLFPSTSSSVAA